MTSPNPKGLAAYLETDPQEVAGWVEEAPLHLVGAALIDLGPSNATAIRSALEDALSSRVSVDDWSDWWKRVQRQLSKSKHFIREVKGKKTFYQLEGKVRLGFEDVPKEPLPSKPAPSRKTSEDLERQRESYEADSKRQRDSFTADLRRQRESHAADLERQRESHAADLRQLRESYAAAAAQLRESHAGELKSQEERLNYQIKSLWAAIDSRIEQSRLAARKDMLLRVGDILQRAYHPTNDSETKLNQVIAHLPLALQDGGAELLGDVGEVVAFDPTRHHPSQEVASGDLVCLTAPGVIIAGGEGGDMVILKANVTPVSEDS